jgi:hypothetical protein
LAAFGALVLAVLVARRLRAARPAQIADVVGIFHQAVVHVVADLRALGADEIDALDRLVDPLAVQDASAQLLNADSQEVLVLALDLAPAGLVFGKLLFARCDGALVLVEDVEALLGLLLLDLLGHDPVSSRANKKSGDSLRYQPDPTPRVLDREVYQRLPRVNVGRRPTRQLVGSGGRW